VKVPAYRVRVDTTEFEFAHGRKPSGRGGWAFEGDDPNDLFWCNGLYVLARREAKKHFAALGMTVISVAT
tara:strand:+ start:7231 stop:7440 length:210 start_codon:yes stop_codon:yes gene_type:complete